MKLKKLLAILLTALMLIGVMAPAAFAAAPTPAEKADLTFHENGKFRVMVLADVQDDENLSKITKKFITDAVAKYSPDLLILTGDNIYGSGARSPKKSEKAIRAVCDLLESTGVPYGVVFGNHDDQANNYSKEEQMKVYSEYPHNLSIDENLWVDGEHYDAELSHCGTYYIPVYASDGSGAVKYVFWMLDSGAYDPVNGGYDHVNEDQLAWFTATNEKLGKPASMAFQHIILPEVYNALEEVPAGTRESYIHLKKYYKLPDAVLDAGGHIGEAPNPSEVNGGEYDALKAAGNVSAVITGHDHTNSFILPYEDMLFINVPTCGVASYGETNYRGIRYFDIDEATGEFTTDFVTYADMYAKEEPVEYAKYRFVSFWTEIELWFINLWMKIQNFFGVSNLVV